MKKMLAAFAAGVVALSLFGESVNVSTVAELTAAVAGTADEIVLLKSGSPYALTAKITVSREVTIRGETGDPADVVINGSGTSGNTTCTAMVVGEAGAVVEGVTFKDCKAENAGGSVRVTAGTVRNCVFDGCHQAGNTGCNGSGVYINGSSAVVSNCVIKNSYVGFTGAGDGIGAYITGGGTLANTLVTGCYRSSYAHAVDTEGVVYLAKGTVKNCTIAKNVLGRSALYVANDAGCVVKDTVCWGNTAYREWRDGRPDIYVAGSKPTISNLCAPAAFGTGAVVANPMFADAANGDFTLTPGSPCIGAGTDGCDLGYKSYDATKDALGIVVADFCGTNVLETTVTLRSAGAYDLTGATVTWDGLGETGASFTHTFGGGRHPLTAHVAFAGGGEASVTLADAVTVRRSGEFAVSTAAELVEYLAYPADGLVLRLAENTYKLDTPIYLYDDVKIYGTGDREKTIVNLQAKNRVLSMGHKDALVAGVKLYNGKSQRDVGGVYIHANGGTVSNCVIKSCTTGTNCSIGGAHMNAVNALITHSVIANCSTTDNSSYKAGGVQLSHGTLADSLVISNTCGGVGGGIYLNAAAEDAKVINCTVAKNKSTKSSGGGISRVDKGGYVINAIVYDNTANSGEPNFTAGSDAATHVLCCAADKAFGKDGVALTMAPYDPVTYELDPKNAAGCINAGTNDFVVSTLDFFGNPRIFNNVVDIGAYEYAKTDIVPGITPSATQSAGASQVSFTATVQGAEIGDFLAIWYLDGSATPNYTGEVYTVSLDVGRHAVRLVLENEQGQTFEHGEDAGFVTIYPTDSYVDVASTTAEWPFDTPAKAASNLNEAVTQTLRSGVTLHIAEGDYRITSTITVGEEMTVVGAGRDATCVYSSGKENMRVFVINGQDALVSSLCVSNALEVQGGVCIRGEGGAFEDGMIVKCKGTVNQEGAGLMIENSKGRASRCIIANNETHYTTGSDTVGVDHTGAGAVVHGGILENSLIVGNKARNAAGVMVTDDGILRNCTVVGNIAGQTEGNAHEGCGGVSIRYGRAVNCIIVDNLDTLVGDRTAVASNAKGSGFSNCCVLGDSHTGCVVDDPQFKDAANGDYRIGAESPCARAGLYGAWMDGATDFFGNPRATSSGKVSIGFFQAPSSRSLLLLK